MRCADLTDIIPEVHRRRADRHLVVLCDFDGTLCEFHPDPGAVWLPDPVRAALEQIAARPDATIGLVSGRRLRDVRDRAKLTCPAFYAGVHGLEIEGPNARFVHPAFTKFGAFIHDIRALLSGELAGLPGVFVEDKDVSIVAHFRGAEPAVQARVPGIVDRVIAPHVEAGHVRVMDGACAREVLPAIDWDKGSAVDWICECVERRHGSAWPLYIGDDVTDEDAFSVVRHRGLAVAVSDRVSGADFHIDGPAAVESLLNALR
jgi:trehalose-phosphatase